MDINNKQEKFILLKESVLCRLSGDISEIHNKIIKILKNDIDVEEVSDAIELLQDDIGKLISDCKTLSDIKQELFKESNKYNNVSHVITRSKRKYLQDRASWMMGRRALRDNLEVLQIRGIARESNGKVTGCRVERASSKSK